MAQRRMLSRSIGKSRKLAQVSLKSALLYTWMIPFLDDFGHYEAETDTIKSDVVRYRKDFSERIISNCLNELIDKKLIKMYEVDGYMYLELLQFEEHQTFRSDRPRKAEYPIPPWCHTNGIPEGNQGDTDGIPEGEPCQRKNKYKYKYKYKDKGKATAGTPQVRFVQDIQSFTNRPPASQKKINTPDYKAAVANIGKLIEEHGYDLILALASKLHTEEGMYSVLQFEWRIDQLLRESEYVAVYDQAGDELVEVWDKEDWKQGCGDVTKKGDKWCLKTSD